MTEWEDVKRARLDEAYVKRCQRALEREEKSVRSGLVWFGIVVLALSAAVALHYFEW